MNGWYIKRDDKRYGPYSSTQLVEMAAKGQVLPIDWVAQGEGDKWMPASQVKGLFAATSQTTAAPPPLPVADLSTGLATSEPMRLGKKLLGAIPASIFRPVIGMFTVVGLGLLTSFFCGSLILFFLSLIHIAAAAVCIVLATRFRRFLYAPVAALLTMTVWGWYCFSGVPTIISILGLLVGVIVGIWAMFEFFRPETRQQFAAPRLPPRLERLPAPALVGILGGGSLMLVLGICLVLSLIGGRSGANRAGHGPGGNRGEDVKVDLPDFSKVDYSFDTSKVDYTKGPQGQKLEKMGVENEGRFWQQFQGPDGKVLFHGKAVQTVQGVKLLENYFFAGYQHGPQTEWHTNGQMKFTGIMKDGKKHGKWQHWHENGKPQKEEYYLSGVKHGPEINWYKDGIKEFESSFVDGSEHGRRTMWWKNGKKSTEIHIKQAIRHGPATWWNENGTLSMRLTFRDGKTSYDPSSGTIEDFGTANNCIFGSGERRLSLQGAFDTYGKPVSGFAEVANLKNETQKWVYRCTDGEAILRCTVVRNDTWKEPRMVDIWEVKKK